MEVEVIQKNETFKTIDGKFQFYRMKGIIKTNEGIYYSAQWKDRRSNPTLLSEVINEKRLELKDRGPLVRSDWTPSPEHECYVKEPRLDAYEGPVENLILREIETCESLKQNPHPNIVSYYGYREIRGRVSGLCFERCVSTLAEKVDPGFLNKSEFLKSGRPLVDSSVQLEGIRSAVQHLHSLGRVHNDITPSNILIAKDGRLVLSDFDSSCVLGVELGDTKRTHGWHNPVVTVASKQNDLDALRELETWLFGSATDEFIF